jgi:hypothetical protein
MAPNHLLVKVLSCGKNKEPHIWFKSGKKCYFVLNYGKSHLKSHNDWIFRRI